MAKSPLACARFNWFAISATWVNLCNDSVATFSCDAVFSSRGAWSMIWLIVCAKVVMKIFLQVGAPGEEVTRSIEMGGKLAKDGRGFDFLGIMGMEKGIRLLSEDES